MYRIASFENLDFLRNGDKSNLMRKKEQLRPIDDQFDHFLSKEIKTLHENPFSKN